ncbi:EI24-like protein, partial [Drosera capensis]
METDYIFLGNKFGESNPNNEATVHNTPRHLSLPSLSPTPIPPPHHLDGDDDAGHHFLSIATTIDDIIEGEARVDAVAGRVQRRLLSPQSRDSLPQVAAASRENRTVFSSQRINLPGQFFWFYPLYAFSIVLSTIWYNDIARHGFEAMAKDKPAGLQTAVGKEASTSKNPMHTEKPAGLEGIMISIGEQVYSVLLLSFFFLEVSATGFIPYIGKALNFVLLSWMYKWNMYGVSLDKRLDFFESNWPFFAGFATSSGFDKVMNSKRKMWQGAGLGRVPIFYVADTFSKLDAPCSTLCQSTKDI